MTSRDVVEQDAERSRFVIRRGDATAELTYKLSGTRIVLVHTGVPRELRGSGLAVELAHAAFEYARANKLSVIPACPFVGRYLKRHPEYQTLVRGRLDDDDDSE